MPETRDINYNTLRVPLIIKSGQTVGFDLFECKRCGSLVAERKMHNKWHKDNKL